MHVIPRSDAIAHSADEDCICGPTPERVETGAGEGWLIVHHSLDGRERGEQARAE